MKPEVQTTQLTESLTTRPKDVALITSAIKKGWQLPEHFFDQLPQAMFDIATSVEVAPRDRVAANNAVMAMDAANKKQSPAPQQPIRHEHVMTTEEQIDRRNAELLRRIAERMPDAG